MKTIDFVEAEDSKFVLQLHTFWSGLKQHGTLLGFSNAEIDDAEKDYLWMDYVLGLQGRVQSFSQGYTQYKKSLRYGSKNAITEPTLAAPVSPPAPVSANVNKRFRKRAAKAKNSPNYSKALGELLNIVAPQAVFDANAHTPELKIKLEAGQPLLKFKKKPFDGFDIYKDDGSGFKKLERVSRSPYLDESPLPPQGKDAAWKYKIIGVLNDKGIGDFSADYTVWVHGAG